MLVAVDWRQQNATRIERVSSLRSLFAVSGTGRENMDMNDLVFKQSDLNPPIGRFTFAGQNRVSNEVWLEFYAPSESDRDTAYGLILFVDGHGWGRVTCGCPDQKCRKGSREGALKGATEREWRLGWRHPDILRTDANLCKHQRRIKAYIKRHKLAPMLDGLVELLKAQPRRNYADV